jgi:hypothetical protein
MLDVDCSNQNDVTQWNFVGEHIALSFCFPIIRAGDVLLSLGDHVLAVLYKQSCEKKTLVITKSNLSYTHEIEGIPVCSAWHSFNADDANHNNLDKLYQTLQSDLTQLTHRPEAALSEIILKSIHRMFPLCYVQHKKEGRDLLFLVRPHTESTVKTIKLAMLLKKYRPLVSLLGLRLTFQIQCAEKEIDDFVHVVTKAISANLQQSCSVEVIRDEKDIRFTVRQPHYENGFILKLSQIFTDYEHISSLYGLRLFVTTDFGIVEKETLCN